MTRDSINARPIIIGAKILPDAPGIPRDAVKSCRDTFTLTEGATEGGDAKTKTGRECRRLLYR